jgi:hypothetical protein
MSGSTRPPPIPPRFGERPLNLNIPPPTRPLGKPYPDLNELLGQCKHGIKGFCLLCEIDKKYSI